ncbi:MAG: lyase family protein, partial [Gammaproteobacteria bacterium]
MTSDFRIERDSMGELKVPVDAAWGAQTQRAVENFPISGLTMPPQFIAALGLIKWAAAGANRELDLLDESVAEAIRSTALEVAAGDHDAQFPVDVFQTGSGTSSNMNANEVIARLATERSGTTVHPNDHVNMGQSSNDVVPSAIHVSAAIALNEDLLPSLKYLAEIIENKAEELKDIVKTGRTHLMDAMPVRLDQELGGWATQIRADYQRVAGVLMRLSGLAQGGTAVGTGINAHPEFGIRVAAALSSRTGIAFRPADSYFEALSCQDTAVELSGQLKTTAVSLMKIA